MVALLLALTGRVCPKEACPCARAWGCGHACNFVAAWESCAHVSAQAFLSLCQGNHYQFDSMRRAKHSSMMVLYHLHNPDAPAFSCSCNKCGAEIEPGQGFRCATCQDFDMCGACKNTYGHQHPLVVCSLSLPFSLGYSTSL